MARWRPRFFVSGWPLLFACALLCAACVATGDADRPARQADASALSQGEAYTSVIKQAPLPDLANQPIRLRVALADNPRFAALDAPALRAMLQRAQALTWRFFHLRLRFEEPETIGIDALFATLPEAVRARRMNDIVDARHVDAASRAPLRASIAQTLQNYRGEMKQVRAYARPYLLQPPRDDSPDALADALVDTLLARLRFWYRHKAADGRPVLDDGPYHQWVWWDSLGYGDLPYDVVITNQLVASAERYDMDVHSSLRGGISAGTTSFSRRGRYGAYLFVSLYALLNDNAMLTQLRGDSHYSKAQIIEYGAALLTHELGHLLLRLGHPFGNAACIMAPTPLLQYRKWVAGLDARRCPVGGEAQMQPGAARITYHADWLR